MWLVELIYQLDIVTSWIDMSIGHLGLVELICQLDVIACQVDRIFYIKSTLQKEVQCYALLQCVNRSY